MDYKLFDRSQQQQNQPTNSGTRNVLGTTQNRALQEGNYLQKRGEVPNNKIRNDVNKRGVRENDHQNRLKQYIPGPSDPYGNQDQYGYNGMIADQYGNPIQQGYEGYQNYPPNQGYQEYYYPQESQEHYQGQDYLPQKWNYNEQVGSSPNYYTQNRYEPCPQPRGFEPEKHGYQMEPETNYDYSTQPAQYQNNFGGYNYENDYHQPQNWNSGFQAYQDPAVQGYGYDQMNPTMNHMQNTKPHLTHGNKKHTHGGEHHQVYGMPENYGGPQNQMYQQNMGTPIPQNTWRHPKMAEQFGDFQAEQHYPGFNNWSPKKLHVQSQQWPKNELPVQGRNIIGTAQVIVPVCLKEEKSLVIQKANKQSGYDMIPGMTAFSRSEKSIDIKKKLLQTWMKKSIKEGHDQKNHTKLTFTKTKLERTRSVDANFFQKLQRRLPQKKTQHRQPSYMDPKPPKKTTRSNSFVFSAEFEGKVRIDRDLQKKTMLRPKSKMATTEKGSATNSVSVRQQPSVNLQKSEVTVTAGQARNGSNDQNNTVTTPAKKANVMESGDLVFTPMNNISTPLVSPLHLRPEANPYSGIIDSSKHFSYQFDSGLLGDVSRSLADFDDSRLANVSKGNERIVSQASILKTSPVAHQQPQANKPGKERIKKDARTGTEGQPVPAPQVARETALTSSPESSPPKKSPVVPSREMMRELLAKLLHQGLVRLDSAVSFDKKDPETGETVKFVAFEIAPQKYNDHFISVKPDVLPHRDNENEKGDHRGEGNNGHHPGNKKYGFEQPTWGTQSGHTKGNKGQNQTASNTGKQTGGDTKKTATGTAGGANGNVQANWEKKKLEGLVQSTPQLKEIAELDQPAKAVVVNGKELVQQLEAAEKMPILEQATHKIQTGKLQRWLKKLNDDEKVAVFKQIKHTLHELLVDQYGKYVVVLFLKTNLTAIVDTLISTMDKTMEELIHNKHGALFCQTMIDVKFKDVRLRRVLKRIDKNLEKWVQEETSAQTVLTYVTMLPPAEMGDFVEYCKTHSKVCLGNHTACKIFAKVLSKVSDVERLEIELHLKIIMAQIFETKEGVELVEVFVTKADAQNMQGLLSRVYGKISWFLKSEDHEYFFVKIAEVKNLDIINEVISRIFLAPGCPSDQEVVDLVNHEVATRTLLSFFTMTSFDVKDKMRRKLANLRANPAFTFSQNSKKLLSLCENYFGSSSPSAP